MLYPGYPTRESPPTCLRSWLNNKSLHQSNYVHHIISRVFSETLTCNCYISRALGFINNPYLSISSRTGLYKLKWHHSMTAKRNADANTNGDTHDEHNDHKFSKCNVSLNFSHIPIILYRRISPCIRGCHKYLK